MINTILIRNVVSLSLFASLVISIQLKNYYFISMWIVFSIFLFIAFDKFMKSFVVTNILFGIGFFVYLHTISHWVIPFESRELQIFFKRLSLVFILVPLLALSFFSKSPFITFWEKPNWKALIYFPFIWSGFHHTKVKSFLLIALTINAAAFMPFVIRNGWPFIQDIWLLAIIFSITNAVLEEVIWRGTLLSRFSEQLGEKWAVVVTSLGFGLQHYSLGFPWITCIAFSLGGLFYGGITIKSRSIFPSIIWHIALNILMVLSGLISFQS
jgi:uncharacterized protein